MAEITTNLSILTLNVNGLNSPIKRHHLANWIKKEDLTICCLHETHLIDRNKLGSGWKAKRRFTKPMAPKTGRSSNTYIKVDFKPTLVKWDKEGPFILIKRAIHQNEITTINLYASNVSAPIKHTLKDLKAHIDSNTVEWETLIPLYHQ
jgi:exonuclease III